LYLPGSLLVTHSTALSGFVHPEENSSHTQSAWKRCFGDVQRQSLHAQCVYGTDGAGGADAVTPTAAAAALAPADIAAVTTAMATARVREDGGRQPERWLVLRGAARALAAMYTAYGSAFGNMPLLQSLAAADC
jgi:hypothetical protein